MRLIRTLLLLSVCCCLGVGVVHAEAVRRLSFRDRLYDLAVDGDSVWAVGYPGLLLRSRDGGASFERVNVTTDDALFSIAFNSGGFGAAVGRSGLVLLTSDHGASWSRTSAAPISQPGSFEGQDASSVPNLFGVEVLENGHIVAVGDFGTILVSEDRGKSFRRRTFRASLAKVGVKADSSELEGLGGVSAVEADEAALEEARLTSVSFADDRHGFIVGEFGIILATEDAGTSWTRQQSPTDKLLFSVLARPGAEALAVGSEGSLLETRDAGSHWTLARSLGGRHLFDIGCDAERCAISGQEGLVMVRARNEPDFRPLRTEVLAPLSAVTFSSDRTLIVAGSRGYLIRATASERTLARVLGE